MSQPRKILIVDDEPNIVTYLEMLLQDEGFETVSAAHRGGTSPSIATSPSSAVRASIAVATACIAFCTRSDKSTSVQPVKRLERFHSLSPCLNNTTLYMIYKF